MKKKVIIATGGTGGHLYPAMATADALIESGQADVLFVGKGLEHNKFFCHERYPYVDVPSGASLRQLFPLLRGVAQSIKALKSFQADVAIGFGSYHSLPPLLAGKALGIPIALHEANSFPGKVVRLLSRFAEVTGVQFPAAASHMKGNVIQIPLPLRKGYDKKHVDRFVSAAYFGIDPALPTLLVFGGSQGAQAINAAFDETLLQKLKAELGSFQVLHFSGSDEEIARLKTLYKKSGICAVVKSHETSMNYAWGCSDLVIARAGASTIAEQLAFEIPAVYIPFPGAADNHQFLNALFVVNEVKGATLLPQDQLNSALLAQKILVILSEEEQKSNLIRQIQNYKNRHSNQTFAEWILNI